MTEEEIQEAKEKYELKMENNKAMRIELDSDILINPFKFGPEIHITIKTLGDIIFHAVLQRRPTFFEDGSYQTKSGKRRTVEDTYKLQRLYNIKCRFKDVKRAFEVLHNNEFITFVFCKRTLVKTYSNNNLQNTIEDVNKCLENNNLNFKIRKSKFKKIK